MGSLALKWILKRMPEKTVDIPLTEYECRMIYNVLVRYVPKETPAMLPGDFVELSDELDRISRKFLSILEGFNVDIETDE